RPLTDSAICTAVAPEAVRTRRIHATRPTVEHQLVPQNRHPRTHHRRSARYRITDPGAMTKLRSTTSRLNSSPTSLNRGTNREPTQAARGVVPVGPGHALQHSDSWGSESSSPPAGTAGPADGARIRGVRRSGDRSPRPRRALGAG